VTIVQTGGLNPQAEDTTATARAAAELEESACWQQEARHWQHKYEEEQQAHISSHKLVVALRQQSEEATADAVLAAQEAAAELVSAEKSARDWQRKHCAALQQLEAARAELATATSAVAEEGEQQYHAAQNQLEAAWREVRRAQAENEKLQHAPERVGMGDEDLRSTCVRQQREVSSRLEATQERQQEAARKKTVASRADQRGEEAAQRVVLASHENMGRHELTKRLPAIEDELIGELIGQLKEIRTKEMQVRREWEYTPARGWLDRLQEIQREFQAQIRIKTKLEKKAQKELDPVGDMLDSLAEELGKLQRALLRIKDEVELQVSTASSGTPDSNKAGSHVSAIDEQDLVALSYW